MSEEDAVAESDVGREDVETAGSERLEDPLGAADGPEHDGDSITPPHAAAEPNHRTATAADGPRATTSADALASRARSASSTGKRDKKKKGRGGAAHGEPAMSVEDLFVTISTVQVCWPCRSAYRTL